MDQIPDVKVRKVDDNEIQELENYLGKDLTYNEKYLPWMNACFSIKNLDNIQISSQEVEDNIGTVYSTAFTFPIPPEGQVITSPFDEGKSYIIGRNPENQFGGEVGIERTKNGETRQYNTGLRCSRGFSRDQSGIYRDEEGNINITNIGLADIRLDVRSKEGNNYSIEI